jgi:hypothetical protein
MEDHDYRVIEARAALAEAREHDPCELALEELREEISRFRKYVRWLIDLADDAADTEYDEEVSQVMIYGGIYIAPADTFKLCDDCTKMLDLIWEGQQCPAPDSAA